MRPVTWIPLAALVLAAATPAGAADARDAASLRVVVLDPSGAAIPGASVSLTGGLEAREAVTDKTGVIVFEALPVGRVLAQAALVGFASAEKAFSVHTGRNSIDIKLSLARRAEDVSVRPDDRASVARGFGSVLTSAEIAALPDDPEEFEAALRRMAGPEAVMRVNGFSGGRLPPKSQIRQIRIQMNPYSAEFHEAGHGRIDILTKPGLGSWRTGLKTSFRNSALNARPPLAPDQPADSYQRYALSLEGPLAKGRTSFALNLDGRSNDGARTIHGTLSSGPLRGLAPQGSDKLDVQGRLEHAWGASHTLRAEYQRLRHDQQGLATSGLDLAERAYAQSDDEHLARFSDTGAIGKHVATETLLELRFAHTAYTPSSVALAVQVLGAFSAGGAQIDGRRRSTGLSLTQNLDWGTKRHSFRAGFRLEAERDENAERRNAAGTFVFPNLQAYGRGAPSFFTQQTGDPRVAFDHHQAALYVQDEFRPNRRATISLGLRNEAQSAVDGGLHLAPRAGVAYSVDGRTTLRIGAGVFREWYASAARAETLRLDGQHAVDSAVASPSFPDPPLPGSGATAITSRYRPSTALGLPKIERISAGLERTMGEALRLRFDYSVERGNGALRTLNRNAPVAGLGRPDPSLSNELEVVSEGRSRRNTLNVSGGYLKPGAPATLFLGYVLTDAQNDGELGSVPASATGLAGEWGPALDDVRHRVFGFGKTRLAKGVSISGLLRLESGAPYNVTTGFDDNGDSIVNDRPEGVARNAARGATRLGLDLRLSWSHGFGAERQSSVPTARVLRMGGDEGMPELPGPDANRRFLLSVYAQAFNATNHTNPRAYFGVRSSPTFGQPLQAEPGRRIELGASFSF